MKNFISTSIVVLLITIVCNASYGQLPNLTSAGDTITYSGDPGDVYLAIDIINNGPGDCAGTEFALYISLDTILNTAEDSVFFIFSESELASGDTEHFNVTIPFCTSSITSMLPDYAFGSDFYILYKLDFINLRPELDEFDNTGGFDETIFINCTLNADEPLSGGFAIYPNPTNGHFSFSFPSGLMGDNFVSIININTRQQTVLNVSNDQNSLDLSFLPPGTYFIEIKNNGNRWVKKIVIAK